ncbi:hypothetical protein M8C21_015286 [Ambrosia artemisiifolia]|uniref:non-specific serine/threonine protein kinase n=1 Tax=Ambrosia artemisiifolia TaxID=4212 RepID=A0AAD5G745_AMBAR|nr:hypothetical protein M8C21_015286 [Ambrosia artemisiifolia]
MVILISFFLVLIPHATSITFNFTEFRYTNRDIVTTGAAEIRHGIQVTPADYHTVEINYGTYKVGRATYVHPLHLWNKKSGELASFNTSFDLYVGFYGFKSHADGLTFFLAENNSVTTQGKALGLPVDSSNYAMTSPFVAVEFDTYGNDGLDPPDLSIPSHVGIDINNLSSVTYQEWSGTSTQVCIKYDSVSKNLTVSVNMDSGKNIELDYIIDLRDILPEWVIFGFTAATGPFNFFQQNAVKSWSFYSSDIAADEEISPSPVADPVDISQPPLAGPIDVIVNTSPDPVKGKNMARQIAGLITGILVVLACIAIFAFFLWRRKKNKGEKTEELACDVEMNKDFETGTGPRRFSYHEIVKATAGFVETNKLGEGGFGGVYKGFLKDIGAYVAVKRVSKTSGQGIKEYMSEVKIISRLRHKNLVELKGWCHERNELLLVYDYMENGSLDFHLFKEKSLLTWDVRYKIAHGIACALIYLQEYCKECILHRDIKSSNVMLDSNFNAKLGDFGLAKLVDHEKGSQTTMLAGTMGYMAPEYVMAGKASKESDIFSFGIVALEIACGRESIMNKAAERETKLLEWVWGLYGTDALLQAVDPRLSSNFLEEELKRLLIVGLWCAHPHAASRPSMRQAIQVLTFEASLPTLPSKIPMLAFYEPPILSSYGGTSSSGSNTRFSNLTTVSSCSSPAALLFNQI